LRHVVECQRQKRAAGATFAPGQRPPAKAEDAKSGQQHDEDDGPVRLFEHAFTRINHETIEFEVLQCVKHKPWRWIGYTAPPNANTGEIALSGV
jgi:hypothetical protein